MKRIQKILLYIILILLTTAQSRADFRHVQDQTGRTVRVPADPRRVVSLAPSITEIIFALKQEKRLVGVTRFSDYPKEAQQLPKIGSYIHPDLEKIVSLQPDICIAVKDGNPVAVIRRLENLHIPVFAVDPRDLNSVISAVDNIGRLLEAETQAGILTAAMKEKIERIKKQTAEIPHKPGVFFQIGVSPIVAVGRDSFLHELILTAGGRNLSEGDVPYPRYSREQVLALSPDILIITSMARGEIFQQVKRDWEKWPEMPAVKKDQVYIIDSDMLDRPGPRMVEGLEYLFRIFHPAAGKE
ncbi:MAG: cobalamin-binding protein [Desulfococcaceae bacterium]|jgi:iron complex transport system substrate-binding protein|nr:cobalamin-binding protein [Desulfococcaceae bacterium]